MKKLGLCIVIFMISIMHIEVDARGNPFNEETKVKYEEDIIHTYKHDRTGLEVIWVENEDSKKSFTLGVKTPTVDSSGVNHIIEHSIFTGSKKYPSTRLFFEASSAYPHLYMNASTSSDLTMYPYCTPYDKCFMALLDIYLDSIFNPNMLENESCFYEEAFHYNPFTSRYGGVVYNEMKGANSNEGRMLFRKIRESIYEGVHYENDSGGDPSQIPELTYEEFIETYKRYYNPSNMMIVLYGELPIKQVLSKIDSYISERENGEEIQVNVGPVESKELVEIGQDQNTKNYFVKSIQINQELSVSEQIMLDLWIDSQMVNAKSPFKNSLSQKGIKAVEVMKDSELKYPTYSIIVSGVKKGSINKVNDALDEALAQLITNNETDEILVQDTIERSKLIFYEVDHSPVRGINISEQIIREWAHEGDTFGYFQLGQELEHIEGISEYIPNILIEGASQVNTFIKAQKSEDDDGLTRKYSEVEAQEWLQICERMKEWQEQENDVEWEKINLDDLIIEEKLKCKLKQEKGIRYQLYESDSNLLTSEIYFPTTHIAQDRLPYLFLYSYLLEEVAKEITPFEGVVSSKIVAVDQEGGYTPYIKLNIITNKQKTEQQELLQSARIALKEKDTTWYASKVDQYLSKFSSSFQTDILATLSSLNLGAQSGYKRYMYESYYPFYEFCLKLKMKRDDEFVEAVKAIDDEIFPCEQSSIAIVGQKEFVNAQYKGWLKYCEEKMGTQGEWQQYQFPQLSNTNVYYKSTDVDYVVYSYDLGEKQVQAVDYLMCAYVSNSYLQPNIRVKKGAYGSGMYASFPDTLRVFTYRDPDYMSSLELIEGMIPIVKNNIDNEQVELAKSGALSQFQNQFALLSTDMKKASISHLMSLMGTDNRYIQMTQKRIINCNKKDLEKRMDEIEGEIKESKLGICTKKRAKQYEIEARIYKTS